MFARRDRGEGKLDVKSVRDGYDYSVDVRVSEICKLGVRLCIVSLGHCFRQKETGVAAPT